jgi:hypothetical protein
MKRIARPALSIGAIALATGVAEPQVRAAGVLGASTQSGALTQTTAPTSEACSKSTSDPSTDSSSDSSNDSSDESSGTGGGRRRKLVVPVRARSEAARWLAAGARTPPSALLRSILDGMRERSRPGQDPTDEELAARLIAGG